MSLQNMMLPWTHLHSDMESLEVKSLQTYRVRKKKKCHSLSCVGSLAILWTVVHQAPLSMGFPRQEYWSRFPFPSLGDLPDPGIKSTSPTLQADSLPSEPLGTYFSLKKKRYNQLHEGFKGNVKIQFYMYTLIYFFTYCQHTIILFPHLGCYENLVIMKISVNMGIYIYIYITSRSWFQIFWIYTQ